MINSKLITRRQFMQLIAIAGASWPLPGIATNNVLGKTDNETYRNLLDPWLSLAEVQEHLFPAGDLSAVGSHVATPTPSPGARDIYALRFLRNTLNAPNADPEEKEFIINGVGWLNDLSIKDYKQKFVGLNSTDKESVLRKIESSRAGSRWLSLMMTYLIEALLSDPVYGGNKDRKGWQWLEHIAGFPTPDADNVYFKLGEKTRRRTKA